MPFQRFSEITPEILQLSERCLKNGKIDPGLYAKYDVKRGLRDLNGKGVLAGLTEIANVQAYDVVDGESVPCEGKLFYRGFNIADLVKGFLKDKRFGFEEATYLLLFGELPDERELKDFQALLANYRTLPTAFVRDIIMKAPSPDMMNTLARSVLTLYSYDENANDISIPNVLRQCLQLIALFPLISVYGYQAYRHYHDGQSLFIHMPQPDLSTAENILYCLRADSKYTELEAKILDLALVLHAEHGGGNNSTFTTQVVTSSGTDTYSAIAAALGSLKGPKHGGANIKVVKMFDDMKEHISDYGDEDAVKDYLKTSTPALFTVCWIFPPSCLPPFSPSPGFPAGAPTGSRSWPMPERSSVPLINVFKRCGNTPPCLNGKNSCSYQPVLYPRGPA